MAKSNPMNQLRCQKGRLDSEFLSDSLTTTRLRPTGDDDGAEEEGFLRVRPCDPEEATILICNKHQHIFVRPENKEGTALLCRVSVDTLMTGFWPMGFRQVDV
ncbi:hypothetical protein TIFTF001_005219 [Ficus carica]|uniref:Uncharacterized protein n=1 Tax=Ficus carica TaxID=3494 RepID=A0AA88CYB3_FICCA|nr:hypothetical protein TIFTF001_005219 [Ficus carica]